MQKAQSSRYQTGNTYRNWLDYFSHSSTAAHSTWRLLIGWVAWKPSNDCVCVHACVFSFAFVSVNNQPLLAVCQRKTERQKVKQTGRKRDSKWHSHKLSCPVLSLTAKVLKITRDTTLSLSLSASAKTSHSLSITSLLNCQSKLQQRWKNMFINM